VYKIGMNALGKQDSNSLLYTEATEQHCTFVNTVTSNGKVSKMSGNRSFSNSMAGSVIFVPLMAGLSFILSKYYNSHQKITLSS
jgi:hypothetical protein